MPYKRFENEELILRDELAVDLALQLQMTGPAFFNAIVCLFIVTTIPIPTLVKLLIVKGNIQFD